MSDENLRRRAERINAVVTATQPAIDEALEIVLAERPEQPLRRLSQLLREAHEAQAAGRNSSNNGATAQRAQLKEPFDPRNI